MAGEPGGDPGGPAPPGRRFTREEAQASDHVTLETSCTCGHTRKYHQGLRIEAEGRCLQCGCEQFTRAREARDSSELRMDRIRIGLDQVERVREIVASLRSQLSDEGRNGGANGR